jgi:predicted SnoaL-like aldol condensation-catalyzing enzyme
VHATLLVAVVGQSHKLIFPGASELPGIQMVSMETQMAYQLEANKQIVQEFYELAFNQHEPEAAAAKYLGKTYRQHNPTIANGAEPFIAFVRNFIKAYPALRITIKRIIAERDLVAVHSHLTATPSDRGSAVMDIFRLENRKIVEHWDIIQAVPEVSVNRNTMF